MRDSLLMPVVAVTIPILHVICLCILHYALPKYVMYRKLCYVYLLSREYSSNAPKLYLCLYFYVCESCNGVYIFYVCVCYTI